MIVKVQAKESDGGWHWFVDKYPELTSKETYRSEGEAMLAGIHRLAVEMNFEWADLPKRRR